MRTALQDCLIHQLVESQVIRSPYEIAAIFDEETITYQELNQRANQLAHYLRSVGVASETFVGICVERSLKMLIVMLGILKAGGTYIPLDPNYPAERLTFIVENSELSIVITQSHLASFSNCQTLDIEADWATISQQPTHNLEIIGHSDHLAYVIYTSGSTGKPKGVQITHRGVVNFLLSMQQEPGISSDDRLLAVTTISFDIAVLELFLPLIVGACVNIVPAQITADGQRLIQLLDTFEATIMQATPATWRLLLQSGWQGRPTLKMLCGGEAMTRSLANQLLDKGASLWNLYGPTETTIWSALHRVEPGTESVPIGHPIANTQIYLIETKSRRKTDPIIPVPVGVAGELCIGGEGVARGYYKHPELNDEKFIADPFSTRTGDRLYRTGDLARYRADGTIEFIGRIDHQAKIRGYRVELGEVEAAISQSSIVQETAVIAKEDSSGNQRLIAYIVSKESEEKTLQFQQVEHWKTVWDHAYQQTTPVEDSTFNLQGWIDSYTGLRTDAQVMQEWLNLTIDRILALRPKRILEIGCGTGLLLFRLAQHCDRYHGIDVTSEAVKYIQRQELNQLGRRAHVTVAQCAAHEIDDLESFDTIIINSVVQYFPNAQYLTTVIEKAVKLLQPGGRIFIGDVRSLPLLETFHTSVQLRQPVDSVTQLRSRVYDRIIQEKELVIDPAFFQNLVQRIPHLKTAEIELKRGRSDSELNRFRYDVTLHLESEQPSISQFHQLDWVRDRVSLATLRSHFGKMPLRITGIPDARLQADLQAVELLKNAQDSATIEQLLTAPQTYSGIHPEDLISRAFGYKVKLMCSDQPGFYEAWIYQSEICQFPSAVFPIPEAYTNSPLQVIEKPQLTLQLRQFLRDKLPSYMIPSVFVWLEKLPLTPNGKIDRRALPEPKTVHAERSSSAPKTPQEQQMAAIWAEVLETEAIGIEDNFFEVGGHSLLAVQLLAQVKATFDVEIPLFYLFKDPTIKGLLNAIAQIQSLDISQPHSLLDLEAETQLDPKIKPETEFIPTTPTGIFLTGATGFLGAFLLYELLQQTSAKLYCLVRASNARDGFARIQANLERYLIWNQELSDRIIPVIGDLTQPYLGLSESEFLTLASQTEVIYHSGALINLAYPYSALRASNVGGTEEILRLASWVKLKSVHFVSTLDVFQSPAYFQDQPIFEQTPLTHGHELYRGYAQTKWVAERLLQTARDRGIPVNIYRPGMISGHSETGVSPVTDLLCRFLKGIIQLKTAPILDRPISMVPVDYVSKAIVHLAQQSTECGQVFHLTNPNSSQLGQLVHDLQQFGYEIEEIPYDRWLSLLRDLSEENALAPLAALFNERSDVHQTYLETSLLSNQHFDCQSTLQGLRGTSIVCPASNTQLLKTYFDYFDRTKFLTQNQSHSSVRWIPNLATESPSFSKTPTR